MNLRIIVALCFSVLAAGSLHAATVTFTGAINELWSNPDNWDAMPGIDDKARVRSGDTPCILDYDAGIINQYVGEGGTVGHLILVDGAQLSVRTWNILGYNGGELDNRHTIEVLGGVLNGGHPDYLNNGRIHVGRQGYGHLIIDYTGEVNLLHQALEIGNNTDGDGLVELRGGVLTLTDNGDAPLSIATGTNAVGLMDFSGGVMKQRFSAGRLTRINDYITNGMITAYGGVGTVVVDTGAANEYIHVTGVHPFTPVPADGSRTLPGRITLEWTVDAGTLVDVWVGTQTDLTDFEKIIDKQVATSVQIDTVKGTRYVWAVDTYAAGADDPTFGPVFDFLTDNIAPHVQTADDVTTWLDNGSVHVAIRATITDTDPTTLTWTVVSEPDDPDSPDAAIAVPAAADTTVSLSALGAYVLQLQADDGEYQGADTMTINVYADSCLAAQSLPGYLPLPGDINADCVVDQTDIDLLLEQWLNCNGLDCPAIEPVDPIVP